MVLHVTSVRKQSKIAMPAVNMITVGQLSVYFAILY